MGIISVVVRTYDGAETWGVWDDLASAHQYAIKASAYGRDVEWAKVVEWPGCATRRRLRMPSSGTTRAASRSIPRRACLGPRPLRSPAEVGRGPLSVGMTKRSPSHKRGASVDHTHPLDLALDLDENTYLVDVARQNVVMVVRGRLALPVGSIIELSQPNFEAVVTGIRLLVGHGDFPARLRLEVEVPAAWYDGRTDDGNPGSS